MEASTVICCATNKNTMRKTLFYHNFDYAHIVQKIRIKATIDISNILHAQKAEAFIFNLMYEFLRLFTVLKTFL